MERYEFKSIEEKWQKYWEEKNIFLTNTIPKSKKFYCLVMFPYPSGSLHMGHVRNYVIGDVIASYKRKQGYDVLHPIGWDSFGLPAENAAIQNKVHPYIWTTQNINTMRQQLKRLGISYDWSREISTCEPNYYKWNQWFFIKMYERNLAYRKEAPVNYCPSCKTVLANEQAEGGVCWRCGSLVEERELEQWFLRITTYAEELLKGHELLKGSWPEEVLIMQKNWIGKSEGAEVNFQLENSNQKITIFTTRPDTLFGATFIVLSPEHQLAKIVPTNEKKLEVLKYIEKSRQNKQRKIFTKEKEGVFTGAYAINPMNNEKIPIYVSDYVIMEYGTGAIMCVPAHDQRDFEFAKKYNLEIRVVIKGPEGNIEKAYEGEGMMINSGEFTGLPSDIAREKIISYLEEKRIGKRAVKYKLKDWLISRQRYWGTPIPIIYCDKCGILPLREEDLPVILPKEIEITGLGESPLKKSNDFLITKCHKCNKKALRETDTMDTFVDSSWYYARYCDPKNDSEPFSKEISRKWLPVEQYIGGIEHACLHLIYARFFHKVMRDLGLVEGDEPFLNLLTQGMVTLGGVAMSKSRGNVVEPESIIQKYGADTTRLFILFAAPPKKQLEWSNEGIEGCFRFLNRVYNLTMKILENRSHLNSMHSYEEIKATLLTSLNRTIKKVTDDIEQGYQFNTAIAKMMEFINELSNYKFLGDDASFESIKKLIEMLSIFAPHISEELYEKLGEKKSVRLSKWPIYDEKYLKIQEIELPVEVNGKLRDVIKVKIDSDEETVKELALKSHKIQKYTSGGIKKIVFIKNKLINFVTI